MIDRIKFKKCIPKCFNKGKNNTPPQHQIHPLPSPAQIESGSLCSANFPPPLGIGNSLHFGRDHRNISELINYAEDYEKGDYEVTGTNSVDDRSSEEFNEKGFEGFGWITGVLIRCILCIFGATLFLRMSWIAGQSGIIFGFGVIALSCFVVLLTAISMSAIATNGEIKNGGCYYLVSRSLGPEYGGAIGLIFYIANTINASMNCVGLAEAIRDILKEYDFYLIDGDINDIRIYAIALCLILQLIIFIGTEFENKTQLLLMVSIVISIFSHFIGTLLPLSKEQIQKGVTGYSLKTFYDNLYPDYRDDVSFISTFGVYFPAMTGIMGGANMSGDLKDPSKSIPKGTMWAIAITTFTYSWAMITTAATTVRDATGFSAPAFDEFGNFLPPLCRINNTCPFGIANDVQLMKLQSVWPPLIIVGIVATTLSSASGCLIGAPRVFQALCADKLYPGISYFAKGHGKNNDPFRAYVLTWAIASAVILIGDLNAIAEVITNFFLAAFALTNFACFDATIAKAPGFRPGFKYYNSWLSLLGSVMCITIMFVLSWLTSLITFIIFALLFLFIKHNKSHINWGTSTEANRYRKALSGLIKVSRQTAHVKTYRPQLLVLTGNPIARQALVDFSNSITKGTNLLVCGHVIPLSLTKSNESLQNYSNFQYHTSVNSTSYVRKLNDHFTDWLHEQHVKGFYCGITHTSLRGGIQSLLQTVGLGKMHPNILMIGYKQRWIEDVKTSYNDFLEYTQVICDAFQSKLSLCILRNENYGLDHSSLFPRDYQGFFSSLPDITLPTTNTALFCDFTRGVPPKSIRPRAGFSTRNRSNFNLANIGRNLSENLTVSSKTGANIVSSNIPNMRYKYLIKEGFVDVWWLYNDGGLILLLAFLLTDGPSFAENCKLRIFTVSPKNIDPLMIQKHLKQVLKKFRISYFEIIVIIDEEREVFDETIKEYETLLNKINDDGHDNLIEEEILKANEHRTKRIMKQREWLLEYSFASSFIIITLPLAPEKVITNPLYMLWLEILSNDMPPLLFVRGNGDSVMTYYS